MVDDPPNHLGPFSIDEAADILGAPRAWFRRNTHRFPHRRYGRRIVFELADLDEIRAMHKHSPAERYIGPSKHRPVVIDGVPLPENLARLKPVPPRRPR
jgi:hypothetical protein